MPRDTYVNWLKEGAVTYVKDQGYCGSGYAFAAIGSLESVNKINGSPLVEYSPQQLIDCSFAYGNMGCEQGLSVNAF